MLLRSIFYLLMISMTWNMVDYVFTRNLIAGLYPPDADSISIPIITNQVLLIAVGILLLPTCTLGSTWAIEKMKVLHRTVQAVWIIASFGLYGLSVLICFSMALTSADRAHIEIGLCYGTMLLALIILFAIDVTTIYQRIFKK